jgi:hypothetical protein
MNTCLSCKNKTSFDRCQALTIPGLGFCGRHARSKNPRIWSVVNQVDPKAIRIQKMWRGYDVRRRLSLAGPGVLKRSVCHNEDELVLLEDKTKVHPFDYFAFEEGGKVWWFDIRSIIGCLNAALVPLNPYTRQPLSIETRRRLRTLYMYRIRMKVATLHPSAPKTPEELLNIQWLRLSQILVENGFEDARPALFNRLGKSQMYILLSYIWRDMSELAKEHPTTSIRYRYARSLKRDYEMFYRYSHPQLQFATSLVRLLLHSVEPYPICFVIMSALFRL